MSVPESSGREDLLLPAANTPSPSIDGWRFFTRSAEKGKNGGSVAGPARPTYATLQGMSGCRQGTNMPTDARNCSGMIPYVASFLSPTLGDGSDRIRKSQPRGKEKSGNEHSAGP
jgi:hypothetical protein